MKNKFLSFINFIASLLICSLFFSCLGLTKSQVFIPEGKFLLGNNDRDDESPEKVIFINGFYIEQTEVTVTDYLECVRAAGCNFPLKGPDFTWKFISENLEVDDVDLTYLPINGVSWFDASNYCEFVGMRLPTEAEWEKAASWNDGHKHKYAYGKDEEVTCADTNFDGIADCTSKVNFVGSSHVEINYTYDMTGNLWEWVYDWYDPNGYLDTNKDSPAGANIGFFKVIRGGSYLSDIDIITTTFRGAKAPSTRSKEIGFRCAISLKELENEKKQAGSTQSN